MRKSMLAAIALLATAGCGERGQAEETEQGEPTTGGEMGAAGDMESQEAMQAVCPAAVEGTTVQAENVEGGAALVFITSGDVDELRERVRHYAAMQEAEGMGGAMGMGGGAMPPGGERDEAGAKTADPMMGEPEMGGEPMGGAEEPQAGAAAMPQVNTRVEDIQGGARLVFIPMESADLEAVRGEVQDQALTMSGGTCPEMSPEMGEEPPGADPYPDEAPPEGPATEPYPTDPYQQ